VTLEKEYSNKYYGVIFTGRKLEWFDKYNRRNYSLENKLIKLKKSFVHKLKDDGWNKNYN
jgi:hypothetical protein